MGLWSLLLTSLSLAVIHDHLIDDISAGDASPAEVLVSLTVKLLEGHHPTASIAFHGSSSHPSIPLFDSLPHNLGIGPQKIKVD
jgi:hypothetical protein